jgi:hypothetical protein
MHDARGLRAGLRQPLALLLFSGFGGMLVSGDDGAANWGHGNYHLGRDPARATIRSRVNLTRAARQAVHVI